MAGFLLCATAATALTAVPVPEGDPAADPRGAIRVSAQTMLHNGRFDAAASLLRSPAAGPDDASARFFLALVEYWRVLYDPDSPARRERLRDALEATIARADGEIAANPRNAAAQLWQGSAHLLLAQLRASESHVLSAAYSAKRARAALERARADPALEIESEFGLGTYQYFADQIPSLLKGLRVLLFLPGGNRSEGLSRLARAAEGSRYFSLEARLLLAVIYADRREGLYDAALEQAARALRERPETLAVLHGAGRLELDLQRPESALTRLLSGLRRAEQLGDVDPSVRANLRYLAASAELQRLRPDLALPHLRPLVEDPARVPLDLRERVERLAATCAVLAGAEGAAPFSAVLSRGTLAPEEIAKLRDAGSGLRDAWTGHDPWTADDWERRATARPGDPTLAFAAGRAALLEGRADSAAANLARATAVPERLPRPWRGAAMLYLGMAHDLRGERDAATRWYGLAAEQRGFPGKEAARFYAGRAFTRVDLSALAAHRTVSGGGTPVPSPRR